MVNNVILLRFILCVSRRSYVLDAVYMFGANDKTKYSISTLPEHLHSTSQSHAKTT